MLKDKLENIDKEIEVLRTRIESGGPKIHGLCERLENVMRDLKVFDQREHKTEQLEDDLKKRFEATVLSLEKITKVLKKNGLI